MKQFDRKKSFIKRAIKMHGDAYDYSHINYVNARVNVKILCKKHGFFKQTPDNHLHKHGCNACNGGTVSNTREFIYKAKKIHGDAYVYDSVDYKNNHTKVRISCKKHGEFIQNPSDHLSGCGCRQCGAITRINKKRFTTQKFIETAVKKHGDLYDYSSSVYVNSKSKIAIICKAHGLFYQRCNAHMSGQGCCLCKESMGEKKIKIFLDNNSIRFIRQKTFNDCKDVGKLKFDFFLPRKNICIEFDGEQHFKFNFFSPNKKDLSDMKRRDAIKTRYCSGINRRPSIIRINYKQYNKIEKILSEKLAIFSPVSD
jgi:very-short-patch-repair endonuclease